MQLTTLSPTGTITEAPARFEWRSGSESRDDVVVVVCDASYAELARIDVIGASSCEPSSALREQLRAEQTFHWYVEAEGCGRVVRTPFVSCQIR